MRTMTGEFCNCFISSTKALNHCFLDQRIIFQSVLEQAFNLVCYQLCDLEQVVSPSHFQFTLVKWGKQKYPDIINLLQRLYQYFVKPQQYTEPLYLFLYFYLVVLEFIRTFKKVHSFINAKIDNRKSPGKRERTGGKKDRKAKNRNKKQRRADLRKQTTECVMEVTAWNPTARARALRRRSERVCRPANCSQALELKLIKQCGNVPRSMTSLGCAF